MSFRAYTRQSICLLWLCSPLSLVPCPVSGLVALCPRALQVVKRRLSFEGDAKYQCLC